MTKLTFKDFMAEAGRTFMVGDSEGKRGAPVKTDDKLKLVVHGVSHQEASGLEPEAAIITVDEVNGGKVYRSFNVFFPVDLSTPYIVGGEFTDKEEQQIMKLATPYIEKEHYTYRERNESH